MTFATTLRFSLFGAAMSAALGLSACSKPADTTTTADDSVTTAQKPAKTLAITQAVCW